MQIILDNSYILFVNGEYIAVFESMDKINELEFDAEDKISIISAKNIEMNRNAQITVYSRYINETDEDFKVSLYFEEDPSSTETYSVDTCCSTTQIPFYDYVNLETYQWNEYPYDKNFREIRDEKLRKSFLLNYNKFFYVTSRKCQDKLIINLY